MSKGGTNPALGCIASLIMLVILVTIIAIANVSGQPTVGGEEGGSDNGSSPGITMGGQNRRRPNPATNRRPSPSASSSAEAEDGPVDESTESSQQEDAPASGSLEDIFLNPDRYNFPEHRTFVPPNVFIFKASTDTLLLERLTFLTAETGCLPTLIADADIEFSLTSKDLSSVICDPKSIGAWVKVEHPRIHDRLIDVYGEAE